MLVYPGAIRKGKWVDVKSWTKDSGLRKRRWSTG